MAKVNLIECANDLPADVNFPNGMVAMDTETLGLNLLRDRLCVCQLSDGEGNVWIVKFDGKDYSAPNLKKLLADPSVTKIFHFARFDVAALYHYLGTMPQPVYCTKIASKLTRTYTEKHGLKSITAELLGELMDKTEQSSDWAAPQLSEAQKHYAAGDVIYLHALKKELDIKLEDRQRQHLAKACFDFLPTRAELDLAGWPETDIFSHA
ncbi:MAG: ribonuclease D [Alphaproteobacteria bacterium]|nr:ribonuclease D [Alphaproteobacteria bacterium]MDD9919833.1 ribonuclease D [Alphaproteobacteria bacterium]